MSDIDESKATAPESHNNPGIEELVEKAEFLLEEECFEEAIAVLRNVEARYIEYVRIFDLLGEALKYTGNNFEAIRYRTLHEVLKGTFGILQETRTPQEEIAGDLPSLGNESRPTWKRTEDRLAWQKSARGHKTHVDEVHRTLSMGQEFVRQEHYDKALDIFDELAAKDPKNQAVVQAIESAVKKRNEKHVLKVLQKWLNNLDAVKHSDV